MQESNIAWTDVTWNPTHGCSKVEPPNGESGCTNCYAERISRQYGHTEHEWTNEHAAKNVTTHPEKLAEPVGEPQSRIFVNSMSDLFHSGVPDAFIEDVFRTIRNTPEHVYQILTKRPGRAAQMDLHWPDNVWMGTSVEDDRVTERIGLLRDCPASTLFISFEPLIGPVGDVDLSGYDWAIVGGESGPNYREMDHGWARSILDQCRDQDVRFFFKQSAAPQPERGTALTVRNDKHGVFEQRRIRELPHLPESTRKARADRKRGEVRP